MARKIIVGDQEFVIPDKFPKSGFTIGLILVLIFAVWSSIYRVELEEEGVLMTLGEYSGLAQSGIHMKWPAPIQTVIKIPTKRELEMEFGQRRQTESNRRTNRSEVEEESLMLTGDLNVAVVPWKTQYRIAEPDKFLFKVKDPIGTFRDMNEAVMREVIGDRSVNEVLTTGRQEIASSMEEKLQKMCDQYENGIKINRILLQKVLPPKQVQDAFNEVNTARSFDFINWPDLINIFPLAKSSPFLIIFSDGETDLIISISELFIFLTYSNITIALGPLGILAPVGKNIDSNLEINILFSSLILLEPISLRIAGLLFETPKVLSA